ncbi:MAG: hypothetical protein ACI8ZN_001664 [Bacteroidia bacterium]|jgi:hypothetical protein
MSEEKEEKKSIDTLQNEEIDGKKILGGDGHGSGEMTAEEIAHLFNRQKTR